MCCSCHWGPGSPAGKRVAVCLVSGDEWGECRNIGLGDGRGYSDVVCGGASPVRLLC